MEGGGHIGEGCTDLDGSTAVEVEGVDPHGRAGHRQVEEHSRVRPSCD